MLVKATQPVLDRIQTQINSLRDSECKREHGKTADEYISSVSFGSDERQIIELIFWGEHLSYRDKLPEEWFEKLSKGREFGLLHPGCELEDNAISFQAWGNQGKTINAALESSAPAFTVTLIHDHLVPYSKGGYHRTDNFTVEPDIHPAVRKAFDTSKSLLSIKEKWKAVHEKVTQFLESTKSVNEAVKLWPELRTFLAVEDQQRLDKEGTTKKARESRIDEARKLLAEIDTQSIVADVVGIKLSAA